MGRVDVLLYFVVEPRKIGEWNNSQLIPHLHLFSYIQVDFHLTQTVELEFEHWSIHGTCHANWKMSS